MSRHKKTKAGQHLSKILKKSYVDLHRKADSGAFVVWVAIVVPVELFAGFDNVVFAIPESHAATSAAKGAGTTQCEKAENLGFSMDLCSYARIDIGTHFDEGKDSPVRGLPHPDLLISNNNNCSLLVKWFDVYHREKGVPHFMLDVPFCYSPQKEKDFNYILGQYHDLIKIIQNMTGQLFDIERVKKAVNFTAEGIKHWKRFLSYAAHRPSGISAFDSFVHMVPYLTLRGTREFVDHYKLIADEAEQRVTNGVYPVPHEKYRLLWDGIAPWHQLENMFLRLSELGANIICSPYTLCMGTREGTFKRYEYDHQNPLAYLARTQNNSWCPYGLDLRIRAISEAVENMGIDGIVFASNRSCKVYSIMQLDQQRHFSSNQNIPAVMIDIDHADVRKYSEANAFLRIEALLEKIDATRNNNTNQNGLNR
jgi:benzoyl-CoA reductase/2-hydroxyglutaryl-CoA dehydratase subunit BcrC/BadD/HgdB